MKFIEWPDSMFVNADSSLVLGILGEDPFGELIDQMLNNKFVKGRSIRIERYELDDHLDTCHLLFVSHSVERQLSYLFNVL